MNVFKSYIKNRIKSIFLKESDGSTPSLIKNGLKVGKNFNRQEDCIIDVSHCWLITIGDNVTLAPRVHILAHDASTKRYTGYSKIGLVRIGNNVFIGAGSIILPNVRIGNNVIIGAGSVVTRDIPDNSVAAGNPAKVICATEDYINKHREMMKSKPVYNSQWTRRYKISDDMKREMVRMLENGIGYVE